MVTGRMRGRRRLIWVGVLAGVIALVPANAWGGLDKGALPTTSFSYTSVVDNNVTIEHAGDAAAAGASASAVPGAGIDLSTVGPMSVKVTFTSAPVDAAADLGWHFHNGFVVVTVTNGTLTLIDDTCQPIDVAAGHSYIESPSQVLDAKALPDRNPDTTTVEWFTTRLYTGGMGDPVMVDPPCTP